MRPHSAGIAPRLPERLAPAGTSGTVNAPAMSHGALLALLRRHGPATRRDLLGLTGLSRTTLVERLDALQRLHLIREGERTKSGNGRPPARLEFDDHSRIVLAVDIGATHARLGVTDLSARLHAAHTESIDLTGRPADILERVVGSARQLLDATDVPTSELLGVGVGFPGLPGEEPGTIEAPAVLRHWDGTAVGEPFHRAFGAPVLLANDAHALAYGEYLADGRRRTMLAVKLATGIGAGLVVDGRLHHGDSRGAGQFGHMRVPGLDALCHCGERGCLATVASGRALGRRLGPRGIHTVDDVLAAVAAGDPETLEALREAGDAVGVVLAGVVTMLDPGAVLFGGPLGTLPPFLDTARDRIAELTYSRTARRVEVGPTLLGEDSAVVGLAALVVDEALEPLAVDALVASAP